jgi:hypothetical protein
MNEENPLIYDEGQDQESEYVMIQPNRNNGIVIGE